MDRYYGYLLITQCIELIIKGIIYFIILKLASLIISSSYHNFYKKWVVAQYHINIYENGR